MCKTLGSLISLLDQQGLSLLILKGGRTIYSSREGGMLPLLEAIDQLGLRALADSTVVDRIVGRAAALLISHFKAKEVYTKLLSRRAIEILQKNGVAYAAERVVDTIRKKDGTDICPFEKMVLTIDNPEKGYRKLKSELIGHT
ncbi:MAG: DUF1893 domain-containing protein [Candidatus Bathyarchaeia archaeon]